MDRARCGTDVNSFPPRFKRFSFLEFETNKKRDYFIRNEMISLLISSFLYRETRIRG